MIFADENRDQCVVINSVRVDMFVDLFVSVDHRMLYQLHMFDDNQYYLNTE